MPDLSKFDREVADELRRFPVPEEMRDVAATRTAMDAYFEGVRSRSVLPPVGGVSTEDRSVPSLVDDHAIPIRIYRPEDRAPDCGLVYMHASAFIVGDLELEDVRCRTLAQAAGCVVVSVDYRLAPEHSFPTPLEDGHSVLRWVLEHAEELSVDPRCVGVGGCSAGGALAAGLAIRCRDQGGPGPAFQLLLDPVLDASLATGSVRAQSAEELREGERMWERYLGGPRASASVYASPASCEQLEGLPPAYVEAAELDALRDEAIAYAQRLLRAGVSAELHVWPRIPHAVELFVPDARIAQQVLSGQADALARLARAAVELDERVGGRSR